MQRWLFSWCRKQRTPEQINRAFTAVKNGDIDTLRNLLDKGVEVNSRQNPEEYTLLHYAVISTNQKNLPEMEEVIRLLLDREANVNEIYRGQGSKYKFGPLHTAVRKNLSGIVLLLMNAGADNTLKNDKNKTPLDYANEFRRDDERGQATKEALLNGLKMQQHTNNQVILNLGMQI